MNHEKQDAVELAKELNGLLDTLKFAKEDQIRANEAVKDLQTEQEALKEQLKQQNTIQNQQDLEGLQLRLQENLQDKDIALVELQMAKEILSELREKAGFRLPNDSAEDENGANVDGDTAAEDSKGRGGRQARNSTRSRNLKPTRSRSTSRRRRRANHDGDEQPANTQEDTPAGKAAESGDDLKSSGRTARTGVRSTRQPSHTESSKSTRRVSSGDEDDGFESQSNRVKGGGARSRTSRRAATGTSPNKSGSSSKTRSSLRRERAESEDMPNSVSSASRQVSRTLSSSSGHGMEPLSDEGDYNDGDIPQLGAEGSTHERISHARGTAKLEGARLAKTSRSSRRALPADEQQCSPSKSRRSSRREAPEKPKPSAMEPATLYTTPPSDNNDSLDDHKQKGVEVEEGKSPSESASPDVSQGKDEVKGGETRSRQSRLSTRAAASPLKKTRSSSLARSSLRKQRAAPSRSKSFDNDADSENYESDLAKLDTARRLHQQKQETEESSPSRLHDSKGKVEAGSPNKEQTLRSTIRGAQSSASQTRSSSLSRSSIRTKRAAVNRTTSNATEADMDKHDFSKLQDAAQRLEEKSEWVPSVPNGSRGKVRVGSPQKERTARPLAKSPSKGAPSSPKKTRSSSLTRTSGRRLKAHVHHKSTSDFDFEYEGAHDDDDALDDKEIHIDFSHLTELRHAKCESESVPSTPKSIKGKVKAGSPQKGRSSRSPTKGSPKKSCPSLTKTTLRGATTEPVPSRQNASDFDLQYEGAPKLLLDDDSISGEEKEIRIHLSGPMDNIEQPRVKSESGAVPSTPKSGKAKFKAGSPQKERSTRSLTKGILTTPKKTRSPSLTKTILRPARNEPVPTSSTSTVDESVLDTVSPPKELKNVGGQQLEAEGDQVLCEPDGIVDTTGERHANGKERKSRLSCKAAFSSPKKSRSHSLTRSSLRKADAETTHNPTADKDLPSTTKNSPSDDNSAASDDEGIDGRDLERLKDAVKQLAGNDEEQVESSPPMLKNYKGGNEPVSKARVPRSSSSRISPLKRNHSSSLTRSSLRKAKETSQTPSNNGEEEPATIAPESDVVSREEETLVESDNDVINDEGGEECEIKRRSTRASTRGLAPAKQTRSLSRKCSSRRDAPESEHSSDIVGNHDIVQQAETQKSNDDANFSANLEPLHNKSNTESSNATHLTIARDDNAGAKETEPKQRSSRTARKLSAGELSGDDSESEVNAIKVQSKRRSDLSGSLRLGTLLMEKAVLDEGNDSPDDDSLAAVSEHVRKTMPLNLGMTNDESSSVGDDSLAAVSEHVRSIPKQGPTTDVEEASSSEKDEEEDGDFFDDAAPIRTKYELDNLYTNVYKPRAEPQRKNDVSMKAKAKARLAAKHANGTSEFFEDIVLPALFHSKRDDTSERSGESDNPNGMVAQINIDGTVQQKEMGELAQLKTPMVGREKLKASAVALMGAPLYDAPASPSKVGKNSLKHSALLRAARESLKSDRLPTSTWHGRTQDQEDDALDEISSTSSYSEWSAESTEYGSSDEEYMLKPKKYVIQLSIKGKASKQTLKEAGEGEFEIAHLKRPEKLGVQDEIAGSSKFEKDLLSQSLHTATNMKWRRSKSKESLDLPEGEDSTPMKDFDAVANSMTSAMTNFDAVTKSMTTAMKWSRRAKGRGILESQQADKEKEGTEHDTAIAKSLQTAMNWRKKVRGNSSEAAGMQMLDDDNMSME